MKKSSSSKAMTPRSIMNQKKAVESRGAARSRTPLSSATVDENRHPVGSGSGTGGTSVTGGGGTTTPTSHTVWKGGRCGGGGQREGASALTPLGLSGRLNRRAATPSTPTRQTQPPKPQHTPTRSDRAVLFEFDQDLLITPCNNENIVSVTHTSSVQVDPTPSKAHLRCGAFNRSRSASSLTRLRKGGGERGAGKMRRSMSEARLPTDTSDSSSDSQDGELSRIAVGVRVRPLHNREYGNTVIVEGNEVKIASELGSMHSFTLDYVFGPTTSQEHVYNMMVKPLVDSAFQGYNACLFAYGQTGSGKSYSMMGVDTEVDSICEKTGIIPRFCEELIERASMGNDQSGGDRVHMSTTVEVSYLEVYNEKIRDLLIPPPLQPLRVREHPVYGPYVADLSKHTVNTVNDIQHWISEGNKQRVNAATEMNEKSSRSHSLFMVILTQSVIENDEGEGWTHENTRRSQINLVDLAGSERIAHSSVSSDRLREGVSINRSLMTLGKVISALVDKRSFVPYRESVLTWLLKESLGGNSRTGMLATVSPCSNHQDETIATLRYAAQARSILNTVRINESPQNKIIRELRAEIERLKEFVESEQSRPLSPEYDKPSGGDVAGLKSEIQAMSDLIKGLKGKLLQSEKVRLELEEKQAGLTENGLETEKTKENYSRLKRKFEEMVVEHEQCLEMCNVKEQAADTFKRRAQVAQNENAVLQNRLHASEEEIGRLTEAVDELVKQKAGWSDKLEIMERSVEDWKSDLEARKLNEDELRRRAEAAEAEVELWKKKVSALEKEARERLDKAGTIERDVEVWKAKIVDIKNENEKLAHCLEEKKASAERWKQELEGCKGRLETAETRLRSYEEEISNCKLMLDAKQREMDDWFGRREDMERQLVETGSQLEKLRSISVQVEAGSRFDPTKLNVSVQTSCEHVGESDSGGVSSADIAAERTEYIRLKKKVVEKRKRLQSLNSELMKLESVGSRDCEKDAGNAAVALSEATAKIVQLQEQLKSRTAEMEEVVSELDLLRELEIKYKNMLDRSIHESEEAWRKKYDQLNGAFDTANREAAELRRQLGDSQQQVKDLIDRLSESNLDRQLLVRENSRADGDSDIELLEKRCVDLQQKLDQSYRTVEALERKSSDLQLKLDQKKNLILELEKVTSRAKEEVVVTQTYATTLKKKYESLESNLKEAKQHGEESALRIEELEAQVRTLQNDLHANTTHSDAVQTKLVEATEKNSALEQNLKERDQQLVELHSQLVTLQKMLQDHMSNKFEQLKSLQNEESSKKDELEKRDVVAVENIRYKTELESTKEQLNRKKKRLEKMKSRIDQLEDVLISTMRQSVDRKNYLLIKSEHAKVFDCMMETSYLFHWEYLLRKARTYAHKYHIPYEFERFDDTTAVVKHLLYNAKSYWFRLDFKLWFENIEKDDRWCRELDEKLPWEVDFGNYYKIPSDKPGAQCPLDESACQDTQLYCCKPGLICPSVWKRTIVQRHLNGLQDDANCLLIYFKTSKNQDLIELLQVISNLAQQIRDKLTTKT